MTRAAIYTRQSRDFTGEEEAVTRQRELCLRIIRERGWELVGEYSDNDRSASDRKKERPDYDRLVADFHAGRFDALVCYDLDRLTRQPRQLEDWIDAAEERGLKLVTANGEADLTTDAGIMFAGIKAQVARAEVRRKSARQRDANVRRARLGKHVGTRRCFGYELDGVTIRESEAEVIREGFHTLLDGGSLREVARMWNAAGCLPPQGKRILPEEVREEWERAAQDAKDHGRPRPLRPYIPGEWSGTTVSRTVRTARLAGMKTYRGEIVRDDDGEPIATEWPGVVDRDTWYAVQAILNDPARRNKPVHYSRSLLSGVARCATCDAKIQSGGKRKGESRYRCSTMTGHVYRLAEPIDRFVTNLVLARLKQQDAAESLATPTTPAVDVDSLRAEASAIHRRMDELAAAFADGLITMSQLQAGNKRAEARLEEIERAAPPHQPEALTKLISARDVRKVWDDLTTDARRTVIDALMTIHLVAPGTKENAYRWEDGVRGVNPDTVRIAWRGVSQ